MLNLTCPRTSLIAWFQKVLDTLQTRKVAVVTIDHPVQQNKILSEKFLKYFVELMTYITQNIPLNKIHFCLTGGATASALIRHCTNDKLFVKGEIAPGVVSLALEWRWHATRMVYGKTWKLSMAAKINRKLV